MNEVAVREPFNNTEVTVERTNNITFDGLKNSNNVMFCTLPMNTPEEKMHVFHVAQNPDYKVEDIVNTKIELTDVYAEVATLENGDNVPRIILVDKEGKSYACASFGMLHSLEKLFGIFGAPHYETPLKVTVKKVKTKNGSTFTLDIVK